MYLRGTGDFDLCRETLQPFMNKTNETQTSLNGVYQPPIHFQNSEFYGFSEFYYCTEDVLRMGGDYNAAAFTKAAKVTFKETTSCVLLRDWRGQWQVMSCPHFQRLCPVKEKGKGKVEGGGARAARWESCSHGWAREGVTAEAEGCCEPVSAHHSSRLYISVRII